jgi:D-alanine-D-alanine ligase
VLTPGESESLRTAAVAMYDALGCRGVARVDFFLTPAGPLLIEVNTTPGFTAHSQVPRMFAAAGVTYPDLVDLLVHDALDAVLVA